MNSLYNQTQENFKFNNIYIAKVVGVNDPFLRNRIQVRILGFISDEVSDVKCPWAEAMTPLFSGTNDKSGISTVPNIGSYVYIQFLYGDPSQPIYTGYVRGNKDSSPLNKIKLENTIDDKRKSNKIGPELDPLNSSSKYPYNNVIETKSGNIIELDDTTGNERIAIEHYKSGSYYEIRPDGTIVFKSTKDLYNMVKANVEEYIEQNYNLVIKGKRTSDITGNDEIIIQSDNLVDIKGKRVSTIDGNDEIIIQSDNLVDIKGKRVSTIDGNDEITINSDNKITVQGKRTSDITGNDEITCDACKITSGNGITLSGKVINLN